MLRNCSRREYDVSAGFEIDDWEEFSGCETDSCAGNGPPMDDSGFAIAEVSICELEDFDEGGRGVLRAVLICSANRASGA